MKNFCRCDGGIYFCCVDCVLACNRREKTGDNVQDARVRYGMTPKPADYSNRDRGDEHQETQNGIR